MRKHDEDVNHHKERESVPDKNQEKKKEKL